MIARRAAAVGPFVNLRGSGPDVLPCLPGGHSKPRQGPRDCTAVDTSQRVIGLSPLLRPTPAHKRCTAEIALNYDQGGACGAASGAPRAGLWPWRGPARRARAVPARQAHLIEQADSSCIWCSRRSRLPPRTSVPVLAAASRAPSASHAIASRPRTRRPLPRYSAAATKTGGEQADPRALEPSGRPAARGPRPCGRPGPSSSRRRARRRRQDRGDGLARRLVAWRRA